MRFDTAPYLKEKIKLSKFIKQASGCFVFFVIVVFILSPVNSAKAQSNEGGHEVKQRVKRIEEIEEKEGRLTPIIQQIFGEKVRLNGVVETNYEYLDAKDIDDENSGSSSDLFISSAALALRVFFNEWSKARIIGEAEDVGRDGGSGTLRLDEAIGTLQIPQTPFYFIGGKTVMPFGVFEDRLIEGPLTEDVYEIDEWGATAGIAPEFYGLDISFSVYRNPQVIGNLKDFDTHDFRPERQKEDKFRSYIANVSLEPIEDTLALSTFYDSEPGDGRRNRSIGGALALNFWKFSLEAEYITALTREKGENDEENKESTGVVGLAYDLLDSLELATRYEVFNDDQNGDQDEVLDYRLIAGFNYSFLGFMNLSFFDAAIFSFEYRFSKFEKEKDSDAADSQNMFQFQLSLGF